MADVIVNTNTQVYCLFLVSLQKPWFLRTTDPRATQNIRSIFSSWMSSCWSIKTHFKGFRYHEGLVIVCNVKHVSDLHYACTLARITP